MTDDEAQHSAKVKSNAHMCIAIRASSKCKAYFSCLLAQLELCKGSSSS
jgi:hypothetical protein